MKSRMTEKRVDTEKTRDTERKRERSLEELISIYLDILKPCAGVIVRGHSFRRHNFS